MAAEAAVAEDPVRERVGAAPTSALALGCPAAADLRFLDVRATRAGSAAAAIEAGRGMAVDGSGADGGSLPRNTSAAAPIASLTDATLDPAPVSA